MRDKINKGLLLGALLVVPLVAAPAALAGPHISYAECKAALDLPDDLATVYLFRPKQKMATGVNFAVDNESEATIAFILNNYFTVIFLEPGTHRFTTQKSPFLRPDEFSLDVEAGRTYFVKFLVKSAGMKNGLVIEQLPEEQGNAEIEDCRLYVDKSVKKDLSLLADFLDLPSE